MVNYKTLTGRATLLGLWLLFLLYANHCSSDTCPDIPSAKMSPLTRAELTQEFKRMIAMRETGQQLVSTARASEPLKGSNLGVCAKELATVIGGWCEIDSGTDHLSISSVWPDNIDSKTRMIVGPKAVLIAWGGSAFDEADKVFYFMGGGHADYGGNEVYSFNLSKGNWRRLTDPSPMDYLFVLSDYDSRPDKPWRTLCWSPDTTRIPASSHTYDGLVFSRKTLTLFNFTYGAANGSCFEDKKDKYRNSKRVLGGAGATAGLYEFNPSETEKRNGLLPLTWRRVFDAEQLHSARVLGGYPRSVELDDGRVIFGGSHATVSFDPADPVPEDLASFSRQPDWGDGLMELDSKRKLVWSVHNKALLSFSSDTGALREKILDMVGQGKSLAFDRYGRIVSWNGREKIYILDPDKAPAAWSLMDWGKRGPEQGDARVYSKWRYLPELDLFAGISSDKTGFWVYKNPKPGEKSSVQFSAISAQKLVDNATPDSILTIPAGDYSGGIFINKPLTLKMKGVKLHGISNNKAIINVHCNGCTVAIEDAELDGRLAGCLEGNCAGIKVESIKFNLTVTRALISNNVIGLLTDNRGGTLNLMDSVIEDSGLDSHSGTLGHGFYAGGIDVVNIINSTIKRSHNKGHLVKSRASITNIEDSAIVGLDGPHSRVIDFPCGGELKVTRSILQQGYQTDNSDLISVGTEPGNCEHGVRPSFVNITESLIVFERSQSPEGPEPTQGNNRLFTWRAPLEDICVRNNLIIEVTGKLVFEAEGNIPNLLDENEVMNSLSNTRLPR